MDISSPPRTSTRIRRTRPTCCTALARHDPARVLAECEAKRQIVQNAQDPGDDLFVAILALPYADHPDYREEWRPTA